VVYIEDHSMFHTLQFTADFTGDREVSRKQPLERVSIPTGTQLQAQLKPYVVEGEDGPVEVADLFLQDGTTTRTVPFACFSFLN
jgi:hypothetical protein